MKTSLTFASFFFSVALPSAVAADALGLNSALPLDPTSLFGALVISLTLLTVVSDYSRAPRLGIGRPRRVSAPITTKAADPLAA